MRVTSAGEPLHGRAAALWTLALLMLALLSLPQAVYSAEGDAPADEADDATLTVPAEGVWPSPTQGGRLDLGYFPPDVKAFVSLRPAEILAHPEGPRIIAALGPLGEWAVEELETRSGVPLAEIEQATIGWLEGRLLERRRLQPVQVAVVLRTAKALEIPEMLGKWGQPREALAGEVKVYLGEKESYYLPAAEGGKLLIVSPFKYVPLIAPWVKGVPHPVPKGLRALHPSTDIERHFTLLCQPEFFRQGQGREIFSEAAGGMLESIFKFLEVGKNKLPPAILLSAHLEPDLFLELRADGGSSKDESLALARSYQNRIGQWSAACEDFLASLNPSDYSKRVLLRFPQMLARLTLYTTAGADRDHAVVRCRLPVVAAHNLVLATQLAVLEANRVAAASTAKKRLQQYTEVKDVGHD